MNYVPWFFVVMFGRMCRSLDESALWCSGFAWVLAIVRIYPGYLLGSGHSPFM